MTNIEVVTKVLDNRGCQDAKAISRDAMRLYQTQITPQTVGAIVRKMVKEGTAGCSNSGNGSTVYWLNREGGYYWNN